MTKWYRAGIVGLLILAAGCGHKTQPPASPPPAPPPVPQPKQNLVVLLPDPDGKATSVTVTNSAGAQTISGPYQAVRVESENTAPTAPAPMDERETRRLFGSALDSLPSAEVSFTLYFAENKDSLSADAEAQIPRILAAIQDRHSTTVSIIGHTDTTATPQFNYELGLRRARTVAGILQTRGVDPAVMSIESHGDADLAVQTGRNEANERNRRVQVVVR